MFKPKYTRPVPPGAKRKIIDGEPHVQLKHDGRLRWFPLSSGGRARMPHSDWHGRVRLANGQRVTVRLLRDRSASETMLHARQRQEDQIAAGMIMPTVKTSETVAELVDRYIAERVTAGLARKTLANLHPALKRMVAGLGLVVVDDVLRLEKSKVMAWLDALRVGFHVGEKAPPARMTEPGTRAKYIHMLNQFLRWLAKGRIIPEVPALPNYSTAVTKPRRALTKDEVERLANASPWPRNLLYRLAFATLTRLTALLAIRSADLNLVNLDGPFLSLRPQHAKTKKGQMVPIPKRLVPELKRLVREMGDRTFSDVLGPMKPRIFDRDLKAAGLSKWSPDGLACFHSLRHSGATHLAKSGVSLLLIKEMGGWSNLNIVAKFYAHLSPLSERSPIDNAMK